MVELLTLADYGVIKHMYLDKASIKLVKASVSWENEWVRNYKEITNKSTESLELRLREAQYAMRNILI